MGVVKGVRIGSVRWGFFVVDDEGDKEDAMLVLGILGRRDLNVRLRFDVGEVGSFKG